MSLPAVCIRRPVFTTMLVLLPVVLGAMAYFRMGIDLFPNVEFPNIIVSTARPGASVDEMEIGVTKLVEESVNTIAGIDELRSTTREGLSVVTIQFVLEKNRDIAQQEVQGKINTIISRLPTGTETPVVDKFDIDAIPVVQIAVSSPRSLRELTELADKRIKDSLSSLSGVGSVVVVGGERRAVNITIDAQKLQGYGLSIDQVRQALVSQNLELPGGRVDQSSRELVLRTMGRVESVEAIDNLIVAQPAGTPPIYLWQLAPERPAGPDGIRPRPVAAVDGVEEPRTLARLDSKNTVFLVVQKQSGTNTVAVIDGIKAKLKIVEEGLAGEGRSDVKFEVIRDQSRFINASLHEVKTHLVLGAILVMLTILLFLRDWRTMLMAGVAIPVSLISTFFVMWMLGMTLNNITMLALVLSIGIVIDDAVVVHENIFRWMEEKHMSAFQAALGATKEIALAVMATTFSLVVIFLPIAFMSGRVGRWFSSFGITCAVAILVSLLVSFTLTPMLCSRFLRLSASAQKGNHHSGGIYGRFVESPYMSILHWALRNRWVVMVSALAVTLTIFPLPFGRLLSFGSGTLAAKLDWANYPGLFKIVGNEFLPKDDQSEFEIAITTPEGWTLSQSDHVFTRIESWVRDKLIDEKTGKPLAVNVLTTIGDTSGKNARGQGDVTQGSVYVRLIDLEDRGKNGLPKFDQFEVMGRVRKMLAADPEFATLRTSVQVPSGISGGGRQQDIEYNLVGPDLERLIGYSDQIAEQLRHTPGFLDVDTSIALRQPELRVNVDRQRAADLGVSIETISATLRTLVGGQIISDYKDASVGEQYDIWLRAQGVDRSDPSAIANLTIPSPRGPIPLASVATLDEARGPSKIERFARQRKLSIIANLVGLPVDRAAEKIDRISKDMHMPADYQLIPAGRAKVQNESNAAFLLAFGTSMVFMYMILAAQFESFIHPITILMAIPITIPFALISLIVLGQPLSLYSILGLFLLYGIVKKNGILQVDYTNVLRARARENPAELPPELRDQPPDGKPIRRWAILEANRTRLRPILMTTLMLVAGMIPIALGRGPGAATRASMAKVIVGGQALSLLLSLLVTPVGYSLFDDLRKKFARRESRVKLPHDETPKPAEMAG